MGQYNTFVGRKVEITSVRLELGAALVSVRWMLREEEFAGLGRSTRSMSIGVEAMVG